MNIFIKAFGKTWAIQVEPDETVISLKRKLLDAAKINDLTELFENPQGKTEYDLIHFRCGTKMLINDRRLEEYSTVRNDVTVESWLPLLN